MMGLASSPKPEYSPDGKPRERVPWRRRIVRWTIIALLLFGVGLNLYGWIAGNIGNRLVGTDGLVRGSVVDAQNRPIPDALVFLVSAPDLTATTNAEGVFNLSNTPTGEQILVVVVNEIGQEFPVAIQSGVNTDVGALSYVAPPEE
ncbi:MAG TPA: carboxypeptidase-like regulatory domain-containing protein [Anaerolineales bacterium]|nr:carboxypeptidase-like regulatory domain-containing protein [Anaerolineales bacterium]